MRYEMPFAITGLGKFYLKYSTKNFWRVKASKAPYYQGKIFRKVHFEPCDNLKTEMNGLVHDFGIKDNSPKELARLRIKPDELDKMRRKKILEDQRKVGFRSDLLFDELPKAEAEYLDQVSEDLTVEQIIHRIGLNLND